MLVATSRSPDAWLHKEEGRMASMHALGIGVPDSGKTDIPIVAYLIEHPGAGNVLIDTGFHPSVAVDAKQNLGRLNARAFNPDMKASDAVPAQLRARGIEPAQVGTVVMTHLHVDHASAISEFPGAAFIVARQEWEAATTVSRPATHGYVRRHFDHAFDFRTIDWEDGDYVDSFATFGRGVDLFGDGSVRCVYTPGHTLGHMSVIVRLKGREVLIAADAIYTRRTLDESALPWRTEDDHLFERSLREIQIYAAQTPDALIIPGHDMQAWLELDTVYE
jgi:glyoxylase-like metal-dependent hydrolase (beta-lactamase superfamily II)